MFHFRTINIITIPLFIITNMDEGFKIFGTVIYKIKNPRII